MSQEPNKTNPTVQSDPVDSAAHSSPGHVAFKNEPEQLGEMPSGYGDMYVAARDPHWLFTYWDFDYSKFLTPRQLLLQIFREDVLEKTIEINEIARNSCLPVASSPPTSRVVF